jgi:hypothetical protein
MIRASKAIERFKLTYAQLWRLVAWRVLRHDRAPDSVGAKRVSLDDLNALEKSGELDRVRRKYPPPPEEKEDLREPAVEEPEEKKPNIRVIIDDHDEVPSSQTKLVLDIAATTDIELGNIVVDEQVFVDPKYRRKPE